MKDWHKIRGEIVEISKQLDDAISEAMQKHNVSHRKLEKVREEAKKIGLTKIAFKIQEAEDRELAVKNIATKIVKNVKYKLFHKFLAFLTMLAIFRILCLFFSLNSILQTFGFISLGLLVAGIFIQDVRKFCFWLLVIFGGCAYFFSFYSVLQIFAILTLFVFTIIIIANI